ncbi:MAG: hypothetical protein MK105_14375 [Crocinitomicaceae bacterium]|nr:hypothetical protein [Crocinitomicaceae bacterium]
MILKKLGFKKKITFRGERSVLDEIFERITEGKAKKKINCQKLNQNQYVINGKDNINLPLEQNFYIGLSSSPTMYWIHSDIDLRVKISPEQEGLHPIEFTRNFWKGHLFIFLLLLGIQVTVKALFPAPYWVFIIISSIWLILHLGFHYSRKEMEKQLVFDFKESVALKMIKMV